MDTQSITHYPYSSSTKRGSTPQGTSLEKLLSTEKAKGMGTAYLRDDHIHVHIHGLSPRAPTQHLHVRMTATE